MSRTGENIYKRKDGRWEGRYIAYYDGHGKAKYKYLYARTYAEIKTKLRNAQVTNQTVDEKDIKYEKYDFCLDEWLRMKKRSVKDSTYIRYKNAIQNHIKPDLGRYPINKISTELMEEYISSKLQSGKIDGSGGLSPKSMSDIMIIIKESFKYAQSNGITVICNFDRISFKKNMHEMRVLSNFEEKRLTTVLLNSIDRYKLGVLICLFTGIRIGELCALQWKNVSLEEKTLKVEKTLQRLQKDDTSSEIKTSIIVTEPKSKAAMRIIPLPDFMIEIMLPFQNTSNSYLLSGESSSLIEPRTMQNHFKKYLRESEIDDANFHCLRHTFATKCIESGFDVKTLSEILGHSSVKITLDKYVHSSMQLKRSNMSKLKLM